MNKYFFDSRFEIKKIDYENIVKNFNIYKIDMDLSDFYNKDRKQNNYSEFFKKIKEIKNLKSFYLNKDLFLLGNKSFKIEEHVFNETFVKGFKEIFTKEELENINKLTILNLLIKSIPNRVFENDSRENIRYIDSGYLYLFIKEKKKKIFKFFKCRFEKDKLVEDEEYYILNLTQSTFAPEELFHNKKKIAKALRIGFDMGTRILIPNETGKYFERNPYNRTMESSFLINSPRKIGELRSYYFTLIKNIVEKFLSEYIILKFNTLENFEYFSTESNKTYFKSKIKKVNKNINIYRVRDLRCLSDGREEEITAKDDFNNLEKYLESLKFNGIKLINKGIAFLDTVYEEDGNWNIFLLNTPTGEDLETGKLLSYDTYKKVKEKYNIISNGLYLNEMSLDLTSSQKERGQKAIVIRVIEELFLKECIKNRDISNLHSKYNIFAGIICIQYYNKRIRKITILEKGKIKIESSNYLEDNHLNVEFKKLLKKFNLEEKVIKDYEDKKYKTTTLNLKFIKINGKDIYIAETGLRVYFDSDEYINQYHKDIKNYGIKSIRKGLEGFLGMSMAIRLNKKENLYYSFYDTGITLKETFSPNIKKLVCTEELTDEDYSIFCESLIFKYLSNGGKLAAYPFFFKLTNEILKDYCD